tara:strand:- start:615 stop:833 length:219 start_codon:yes stop_codon:yes gene_type:complete
MSNFVNDMIADEANDTVAAMTDVQVAQKLTPENLTIVAGYTGVENDGRGPMDYARQLVTEQVFDELLEARSI